MERAFRCRERGKMKLDVEPRDMFCALLKLPLPHPADNIASKYINSNYRSNFFKSNSDSANYRMGETTEDIHLCASRKHCYFGNMTIRDTDEFKCCNTCEKFYHGSVGGCCSDDDGNCFSCSRQKPKTIIQSSIDSHAIVDLLICAELQKSEEVDEANNFLKRPFRGDAETVDDGSRGVAKNILHYQDSPDSLSQSSIRPFDKEEPGGVKMADRILIFDDDDMFDDELKNGPLMGNRRSTTEEVNFSVRDEHSAGGHSFEKEKNIPDDNKAGIAKDEDVHSADGHSFNLPGDKKKAGIAKEFELIHNSTVEEGNSSVCNTPESLTSNVEVAKVVPGSGTNKKMRDLYKNYKPRKRLSDDFSKSIKKPEKPLFVSSDITDDSITACRIASGLEDYICGCSKNLNTRCIDIYVGDYQSLLGRQYLNDNVVYLWMYLISMDVKNGCSFHSADLYKKIICDPDPPTNFLKTKIDVLPIVENTHWSLIVLVSVKNGDLYICHLDSLPGSGHKRVPSNLRDYIKATNAKHKREQEVVIIKCTAPRQKNGYDCGVFVCLYASIIKQIMNDLPYCETAEEIRDFIDNVMEKSEQSGVLKTLLPSFRHRFQTLIKELYRNKASRKRKRAGDELTQPQIQMTQIGRNVSAKGRPRRPTTRGTRSKTICGKDGWVDKVVLK